MHTACRTENSRWLERGLLIATVLRFPLGPAWGQSGWKAGAAKVDITPKEPIWLAGYAGRTKASQEIIQHIFVKGAGVRG
jgi:hypothetical protein